MQRVMRVLSVIAGLGLVLGQPVLADTTVFNDTFGDGSTLNQTPIVPTANATTYEIASTKDTVGSSISSGDFKLTMASTSSGFVEAQALFTTAPVSLVNVGDYVKLSLTFTNTSQIAGGTSSFMYFGLYNSGGSYPLAGVLTNAGLSATAGSPYATGGAQLWQGYVSKLSYSGGSSASIVTRPQQNGAGTTSANQDLVANNVGGGAYNNPASTTNMSKSSTISLLTAGAQYTEEFKLTLSNAGSLQVISSFFDGSGGLLYSQTNTETGANVFTTSFDGLAFGYRFNGTSAASTMDVNSITITTNVVPEPSTLTLAGLGIGLLLAAVRSRRR